MLPSLFLIKLSHLMFGWREWSRSYFFRLVELIESNGMDRDINTIICSFHGPTYHKWTPTSSLVSTSPLFFSTTPICFRLKCHHLATCLPAPPHRHHRLETWPPLLSFGATPAPRSGGSSFRRGFELGCYLPGPSSIWRCSPPIPRHPAWSSKDGRPWCHLGTSFSSPLERRTRHESS